MDFKTGWRKVKDLLMPYPEEAYDDVEEQVLDEVEEAQEKAQKRGFGTVIGGMFGRSSKAGREETVRVANGGSYTYDDDAYDDEPEPEQPVRPKLTVHEAPKLKVRIYTPTTFDEVVNIADDLRDKKAVVVNYERVDVDLQRRLCDFVNGSCYVQDGGVKRICNTIVLYVPEGVNVSEAMSVAALK